MPAEPVRSPAEVIVPVPVADILPEVERTPEASTVNWLADPTESRALGALFPIPTLPLDAGTINA
jgi:hypothetical protein